MNSPEHDVIVVGAGNAALCAALSAREHGARVVVLECAPEAEGGNSRFAGGVMRFAFDGVDDLRKVAELTDEEIAGADFGTYTRAQYFDDLFGLTQYRTDPTLVELLVTRSLDTMIWLRGQGARFVPIYGRQAGKVGGRWTFFGGLPLEASGGGAGLVSGAVFGRLAGAPAAQSGGGSGSLSRQFKNRTLPSRALGRETGVPCETREQRLDVSGKPIVKRRRGRSPRSLREVSAGRRDTRTGGREVVSANLNRSKRFGVPQTAPGGTPTPLSSS